MKIGYKQKRFTKAHRLIVNKANEILSRYTAQGFPNMTLRQLYYRFVALDIIPNTLKSYKRLGGIIGEARLAGLIDWEFIDDRVRNLAILQHFRGPQDALNKLVAWYHVDMWENQKHRPEVWIEKDALSGVISGVCEENDIPYFCCRGYTSLSEMWRASQRLKNWATGGQVPFIIHFGDHDPSGIDMSRDIEDRLGKTFRASFAFKRVALNMDQIEEYQPPPNPAKVTDSRYQSYLENFGEESWELDALEPPKFREIILQEIDAIRDKEKWEASAKKKEQVRKQLKTISQEWEELPKQKKRITELQEQLDEVNKKLEKAYKPSKRRKKKEP